MVDLLDPPPVPTRKHPNLILHCGAHAVELKQVSKVKTPRATDSWQPIPHHQLIETVQRTLSATRSYPKTLRFGVDWLTFCGA